MASTFLESSLPITISQSDTTSRRVILVKNHLRANVHRWPIKLQDKGTLTLQRQFSNKELTVYDCI